MRSRVNMCLLCQDLGVSDFLPAGCVSEVLLAGALFGTSTSPWCQGREPWSNQIWSDVEVALQALWLGQADIQSEYAPCCSLALAFVYTRLSPNSLQPSVCRLWTLRKDSSGPVPGALSPEGQTNCSLPKLPMTDGPPGSETSKALLLSTTTMITRLTVTEFYDPATWFNLSIWFSQLPIR